MFAGIVGLMILHRPLQIGVAAAIVAALYVLAGIPAHIVLRQLWPLRWLLLIIGVLQVVLSGWQAAVVVCGGFGSR